MRFRIYIDYFFTAKVASNYHLGMNYFEFLKSNSSYHLLKYYEI